MNRLRTKIVKQTNKSIQCHGFKFRCPNEVVTFGKPLYISLWMYDSHEQYLDDNTVKLRKQVFVSNGALCKMQTSWTTNQSFGSLMRGSMYYYSAVVVK